MLLCVYMCSVTHLVQLFATPWTVALQAPITHLNKTFLGPLSDFLSPQRVSETKTSENHCFNPRGSLIIFVVRWPLDKLLFQTMQSRFSMKLSRMADLSATWNPTPGSQWCTLTTASGPPWRSWRPQQSPCPWEPTTSTPWASPPRSWPRRCSSMCQNSRSPTAWTLSDRP